MERLKQFIKSTHLHFNWTLTILAFVIMLVIVFKLIDIQRHQVQQTLKQEESYQLFSSSLSIDSERMRYTLFMRDVIIDRWKSCKVKKLDYEKAFRIADVNYREFKKYPFFPDPLLLLAMQYQESNFGLDTISYMHAKGLNQLTEGTAKLICPHLQLSYSDSLAFDIDASTRIAAKYMEVLYSAYNNFEHIIVAYNGGDRQIMYYKGNTNKMAQETREYVPKVINRWRTYQQQFKTYRPMQQDTIRIVDTVKIQQRIMIPVKQPKIENIIPIDSNSNE
ncbi:MAG: transglycosylase SLT domain-containing protein [Nitrosarchaeum sp.]|nr:transglycosylase SLT domain-containing protein [Nitrosarchaeum sp.]